MTWQSMNPREAALVTRIDLTIATSEPQWTLLRRTYDGANLRYQWSRNTRSIECDIGILQTSDEAKRKLDGRRAMLSIDTSRTVEGFGDAAYTLGLGRVQSLWFRRGGYVVGVTTGIVRTLAPEDVVRSGGPMWVEWISVPPEDLLRFCRLIASAFE